MGAQLGEIPSRFTSISAPIFFIRASATPTDAPLPFVGPSIARMSARIGHVGVRIKQTRSRIATMGARVSRLRAALPRIRLAIQALCASPVGGASPGFGRSPRDQTGARMQGGLAGPRATGPPTGSARPFVTEAALAHCTHGSRRTYSRSRGQRLGQAQRPAIRALLEQTTPTVRPVTAARTRANRLRRWRSAAARTPL